ncbi:hypothetical protein ACPB9J_32270 [Streptomyces lavendulocolor]|uniref:hypothetical protein n=1 Tax=Streptomyces lavendulocolor TaxID=67316 RepID=UPI003C2CFA96
MRFLLLEHRHNHHPGNYVTVDSQRADDRADDRLRRLTRLGFLEEVRERFNAPELNLARYIKDGTVTDGDSGE